MVKQSIDAKAYLNRIRLMDKKIDAMQDQLEWLKTTILRITPTLKEDVVSGGGSQDKLGDTMAKICDLKEEINREIDILVDERSHTIRLMNQMKTPEYFEILYKRYMEYKTYEEIAAEMHYGREWACRLHGRALQEFKRILEEFDGNRKEVTESHTIPVL